jgi:hypothetical protein
MEIEIGRSVLEIGIGGSREVVRIRDLAFNHFGLSLVALFSTLHCFWGIDLTGTAFYSRIYQPTLWRRRGSPWEIFCRSTSPILDLKEGTALNAVV